MDTRKKVSDSSRIYSPTAYVKKHGDNWAVFTPFSGAMALALQDVYSTSDFHESCLMLRMECGKLERA